MAEDRDWDREMAKIDRLMGKEPPSPSPAPRLPGASNVAATTRATERNTSGPVANVPVAGGGLRVWLTTLLGPVGVAALVMWPYGTTCGTWLWVYLLGVLAVFGASLMAMRAAWQHRRPMAMAVGVLTLIAALGLAAMIVLPRVGYAAASLTWTCST
ncbi:MAG TPA: hypothetical protein VFN22_02830 [Gemmatimonadales bacterium]|nr:hypothetical protein [Gemmatimonadales bacterium]